MLHPGDHAIIQNGACYLLLEYIEPMCIEAHLEAHVYVLYIPTHLGLEEYNNYYPPTFSSFVLFQICP